jgi:hypothetical protein
MKKRKPHVPDHNYGQQLDLLTVLDVTYNQTVRNVGNTMLLTAWQKGAKPEATVDVVVKWIHQNPRKTYVQ